MTKQLIISIILFWGARAAFGQCGSTRDTDYPGTYASSTSDDHCSSCCALFDSRVHRSSFSPFSHFPDIKSLLSVSEYSAGFSANASLIQFDHIKLPKKPLKEIARRKRLPTAPVSTRVVKPKTSAML